VQGIKAFVTQVCRIVASMCRDYDYDHLYTRTTSAKTKITKIVIQQTKKAPTSE